MANKRPLVLFSGGLDSTYRMWQHTKAGTKVDYLYIQGGQGETKATVEQASVDRIIDWLFRSTGEEFVHHSKSYGANSIVRFGNSPSVSWAQAIPWLISALEKADPDKHSVVEISYVMGDEILSQIENFRIAWKAMWSISKQGEFVPLEFPLVTTSKQKILKEMPPKLYELTWVCEKPILNIFDGVNNCVDQGRSGGFMCNACETRLTELYRYELRNGKTLAEAHAKEITRVLEKERTDDKRRLMVNGPDETSMSKEDLDLAG